MAPHPITPAESAALRGRKAELRREALARRDALPPEHRREGSARIAGAALAVPDLAEAAIVGAFWPIRSEADPRPIAEALFARGRRLALPKVTPDGLVFREWRAGDALVAGGFGLSEPGEDAAEVEPDALIVPLAAFDRHGGRVGYGRGYYDGAIARLSRAHRVLTVGIAFACQEVAAVPMEPHDRPLDHLVTEEGRVPLAPR